jgi:hypothetical protein
VSPSGRSSQRVEGTADGVCSWDVQIHLLIYVESYHRNMKALGVIESKWDPIRRKLVRRLLAEQDKVLRSYFTQMGGTRSKWGDKSNCKGRDHVRFDKCVRRRRLRTVPE